DAVIIATGSIPNRLEIPGGKEALTVHELVARGPGGARRAVVYDQEGFNRPLVAADLLSARGVLVEFVTPLHAAGPKVGSMMIDELTHQLMGRHVNFHPGHELVGWDGQQRLRLRQVVTREERLLQEIDLVVGLVGSTSVSGLAEELRGAVERLHVIGDAQS